MKRNASALVVSALGLLGCAEGGEVVATPWNLRAEPSGGELQLRIRIGSTSCNEFRSVHVTETERSVRVDASVRLVANEVCTADDAFWDVTVDLDEDLRARNLLGCRPSAGRSNSDMWPSLNPGQDCQATVAVP